MKKTLIVIGGVLVVGLIAAGSFWGGMAYQSNQVDQVRARFVSARGPIDGQVQGAGMDQPAGQFPQGRGPGGFMGGTSGIVKTLDGDVLTISTAQDVTTVSLSDATVILKTVTVGASELQPGMRVMITGERDDHDQIIAAQVTIVNENGALPGLPAPTEKVP